MNRRWEFDALRGLMLVMMTATHLPTRFSDPLGQPLGYVSAAEGFVLLSGLMAGLVYSARARSGPDEMRAAFLRRALKVYACQAGMLIFLLTVVAVIGALLDQPAINDLLSFYRERPLSALFGGLALVYQPPLLDILPMYVLFLLMSPVVLMHGLRNGWGPVLGISAALWLAAQFSLGFSLYEVVASLSGLNVPYEQTGAFNTLSWQLLWVLGLWLGAQVREPTTSLVFPRWVVAGALAFALLSFLWRHAVGQVPFPGHDGPNLLFSKWQVGPMRLINVFALIVLAIRFAGPLKRWLPRIRALESMGAASLPVFCAHLVIVLLALAFVGAPSVDRPIVFDAALLSGSLALLYVVARLSASISSAVDARLHRRREAARKALA